jgi:DNA-binding MurR/RpiR family transcriptional regulator
VSLEPEDVEAIARRVAELLADRSQTRLVDAIELAAALGVSPTYVYRHARQLGARRLGDGPKARLRFDLEQARSALIGAVQRSAGPEAAAAIPAARRPHRRRAQADAATVPSIEPRTKKRPPALR